jgi:predicted CopG family antitoxin
MMPTVNVHEDTYAELRRMAGDLRAARGRPVPIGEVIRELLNRRKPSEYVGSWRMDDEEAERIFGGRQLELE